MNPAATKEARRNALQKNETNLYIRGIKPDVTEEQFRAAFEQYGEINSVKLVVHSMKKSGADIKMGFCNYKNPEYAKECLQNGSKNESIKELIDFSSTDRNEFIFLHQQKDLRQKYLKSQRKPINPGPMAGGMPNMQTFMKLLKNMYLTSRSKP